MVFNLPELEVYSLCKGNSCKEYMTKIQKVWLWVFSAMFIIPEILFSFIVSFFASLYGVGNFPFLYEYFINPQFFIDNPTYLFIILIIECLGMLGLLVWNVKFNNYRYKIILTAITTLTLILLLFIFFVGYLVSNMSFP